MTDNPYILDILSQPQAMQAALDGFDPVPLVPLADGIQRGEFDRLVLTGMGGSLYACYPAWLALLGESALAASAAGAAWLLDLDLAWGAPLRDGVIGLGSAVALGAVNHALLTSAPSMWIVNGVRAVYHEVLVPLFGTLNTAAIIVIGIAAGVGEEWLFRGVLQSTIGLLPASLAFGAAHVGGRAMLAFGVWAAVMGLVLGSLAIMTGGLLAPMVAHGAYDVLALMYVRRDAARAREPSAS
jgi:membrane protease YdiL (CAAX protease family)